MTGSAGQKRVPKDYFAHNPFPLPPLAEQKRIVAKVDELMALCDDLKERQAKRGELRVHLSKSSLNALTTADASRAFTKHWGHIHRNFDRLYDTPGTVGDLRQNILQLAVQGKLVPQDPNDEPAEVLLSRISEERTRRLDKGYPNPAEARSQLKKQQRQQIPSGLPRLPAGWKWASLIQSALVVVDCHNKTAPYASKGIPLLRTSNIRRGKLALDTLCYVTPEIYERWSARCIPEAGDILITREAPMGEVARIPDGMQVCMGQRIMLIRCLEDLMSADFLLLSLRSPDLMNRVQDKPVGSTVKHLRVGGVETLLMPTPPLAEQKRIAAKVDELMALCDDLEAKLQQGRSDSERLMEVLVREICT